MRTEKREQTQVLVYDTDATNPYGRELTALLGTQLTVSALLPVGTEWVPASIAARCVLPSNAPSYLLAQIYRQIYALVMVAVVVLFKRTTIALVTTRGWHDELFFAGLALLGQRIVVIAHDPVPKWPLSRAATFSRRILWKWSKIIVAHSEALANQASVVSGRNVEVVPHLPFVEYSLWAKSIAPNVSSKDKCRLLVLGRMRPDKGLDRLPEIFRLLPVEIRKQISISFTGPGDCREVISQLTPLVSVTRVPSDRAISDIEIVQELAKCDVLLAPYPIVSASGSVVLALSRGLRVIAYNTGALAEVVAAEELVPLGDEQAFALCIASATKMRSGNPLREICAWRQTSLRTWLKVLELDDGQ